jgi:hypothetical protein
MPPMHGTTFFDGRLAAALEACGRLRCLETPSIIANALIGIARFFGTLLLGREQPSGAEIEAVIGPCRILRYVCRDDDRDGVTSRSH